MAGLEGKILDRYELRRLIGKGGMADVYEAYDPHFERIVAVKVFKREDEDMLRRFIREARLMASLRNEHLLPIYDTGSARVDGLTWYYIVMPFMEGGTLRSRIRRAPLEPEEACRCLDEIADALDYIHSQGIIHRDIKASNVLLDAEGHCYLSDFGIARMTSDATQLTSTGNVLGTVEYVAPELFEGDNRANAYSDLYSLGVLLFEMVTGRLPFTAENQIAVVTMHMTKRPPTPSSLAPQVSPAVDSVILRALAKRPEQRYPSAGDLADAFCRAVRTGWYEQQETVLAHAGSGAQNPLVLGPTPVAAPPRPAEPPYPTYGARNQTSFAPQGVPLTPPPPSPARKRGVIVAILALIILLILTVPLAYMIIRGNTAQNNGTPTTGITPSNAPSPSATVNTTATAQAHATATAQAQANATSTAIAGATATVQARATATAGVIQTATAGNPSYTDQLNNADNSATQAANWDQDDNCTFESDGYHVTQPANALGSTITHGCHEANNTYANLTLSVKMKISSGHAGGVFFRLHTGALNVFHGYLFEVDDQGRYRVSIFNNGATPMQDWTPSSALKKGNGASNTLQLIARGSSLSFYANGVYLTTLSDSTFGDGTVGFAATASDEDAEVVYSDLNVYPA